MRVFVTDGDSRAALAVTRSLGRKGHEVIVGEKYSPSLAHASRYCSASVIYPDPATASSAFVDYLAAVIADRGVDVLVPVADISTFLVTGHRDRFNPDCAVPCADAHIVERAANKIDIVETAMRLGVPVPATVMVTEPGAVPEITFDYPLVVKPRQSRVSTPAGWVSSAVTYAESREALMRDLAARPAHEFPLMLQERVVGPGVGVFALYDRGRATALFSHRRLRERPPSGGVSVLSESIPLPPKATAYATQLLNEIAWHGVAMVEFKHDVRDDTPKLMEINGRFWGSLQLAVDAGVDFPALLIDSLHSRVSPLVDYRIGVRNRWFWGDVDSLLLSLFVSNHGSGNGASRGRTVREFLKLWGKDLYYENPTFRDIRPGLLESYRWLQKGLTRSKAREGQGPAVVATQPAAASTALPARGESGARIVSALDKAGLDEQAWNALAAASETHSVFQTHQWMRSWLSVFGDQCEPLFVTAFNGSAPAAVAPLMVEQSPYGERVIKFLGDGRADYCDVLAAEGKASLLSDIFEALRKYGRWDIIELNSIPEQSQTVPMLRTFCEQSGSRFLIDDHFVCPTLLIEGHEASARKILNKSSLRRAQNYFERSGRVERRNLTGAVEIDPYLDRFFSQHVRRWSGTPSPSLFLNPRNQAFYRNLAHCLSGTHWLLFSVVEFNGNPVAFHYGFDYDGVVMWYKPSFDITHAAHSPGMLMVRHLLDYAIGQRRRELDFTVGDEAFKRRFTNQKRKTVRIQIFRDSARYMYERSRRTVLTAMKKTLDAVGAADHADRAVAK